MNYKVILDVFVEKIYSKFWRDFRQDYIKIVAILDSKLCVILCELMSILGVV